MIKFEILSADGAEAFVQGAVDRFGFSEDELSEIVDSFLELALDEDIEVGLTVCHGCVLARIFDMGRYMFVYPIGMADDASEDMAIEEIREYAVREELPLVITDIPEECIGGLAVKFNHTVIDREAGGESFRLEARSECALLDGRWPSISFGGVTLSRCGEENTSLLARLNRDADVNKYWGYDVISDVGEISDEYFIECAEREFNMGTSVSLAVLAEVNGSADGYVGEAILYGFDLSGGAEFAVRILPEYQGRGLGSGATRALIELCSEIGISRLYGRADERNIPSVKMLDGHFLRREVRDGIIYYVREI